MRTLLVTPIAAALVVMIAGAGTGSGAVGSHRPGTKSEGYRIAVTFSGTLKVHWGFKHSEHAPYGCGVWAAGGGLSKFHASSTRPALGYLNLLGLFVQPHAWAGLSLQGKASGTAKRSIDIDAGGVNWGPTPDGTPCTGVRPRRPESIDCGTRSLRPMRAIIAASNGVFAPTLDHRDELAPLGRHRPLILLTIFASREPFSSCGIPSWATKPHYAPTFILARALRVEDSDVHALRYLRKGETHPLTDFYGGACTHGVPARECAFVLDLKVTITRV